MTRESQVLELVGRVRPPGFLLADAAEPDQPPVLLVRRLPERKEKGEVIRREKALHRTGGLLKTEPRHLFAKDDGVGFQDLADGVLARDSSVVGREMGGRWAADRRK